MKRENRYLVIKKRDVTAAIDAGLISFKHADDLNIIAAVINDNRERQGKGQLQCVVVESDWPEYETVWAMIETRVNGLKSIRQQHANWSDTTFGKVGPIGPLKHLSKEALEAAAKPDDLSEWADMQFLLWDAQRRAGITDEQINQAMVEKLAINKARSWPEPKDGEPRLHIKGEL